VKTILEQLIVDFHERKLPSMTERTAVIPWLSGKVDAIVGMRRTGKTWFLYQVMKGLVKDGRPRETILYLNFEDERLLPMTTEDLGSIPETYFRLFPALKETECAFFFDEIHTIPGWDHFIRRLVDTENVHICLTGSSAKLLSREIATSLRGRSIATEMFPFSFTESLVHAGVEVPADGRVGAVQRARLSHHLRAYLLQGGFPEIQDLEEPYRIRILQDYLDVVILRDVVERHGISNTVALRYLIRHLLGSPAGLFSVNRFYNDLRSRGIAVSKDTLHGYLDHLTDAYLFFQVPIHTASERQRHVNPRKVYAIDPGLVHACGTPRSPDWGHLLETFVFLNLRRQRIETDYYRTKTGREIDFVTLDPKGQRHLIQVCADMYASTTRNREITALGEAMEETGVRDALIITLDEDKTVQIPAGTIRMVPAWRWAL